MCFLYFLFFLLCFFLFIIILFLFLCKRTNKYVEHVLEFLTSLPRIICMMIYAQVIHGISFKINAINNQRGRRSMNGVLLSSFERHPQTRTFTSNFFQIYHPISQFHDNTMQDLHVSRFLIFTSLFNLI